MDKSNKPSITNQSNCDEVYQKLDLINYLSIIMLERDGNYAPTQSQIDAKQPEVLAMTQPALHLPVTQQTC